MTDYLCMFSTSDRHRKLNQLRWQNMSAHLTNETSYLLKKRLMHLDWAIHNVSDLNIDPHICFFPTLSRDRARPIPLAQSEACPQRSERPVCARSPHRRRNGYPGCSHNKNETVISLWRETTSLYWIEYANNVPNVLNNVRPPGYCAHTRISDLIRHLCQATTHQFQRIFLTNLPL